jgi:hypothetical protein
MLLLRECKLCIAELADLKRVNASEYLKLPTQLTPSNHAGARGVLSRIAFPYEVIGLRELPIYVYINSSPSHL